jgi:hypothetical protein
VKLQARNAIGSDGYDKRRVYTQKNLVGVFQSSVGAKRWAVLGGCAAASGGS